LQEIRIDFCRSRRAPRWIVPALLAVAVAFAGDVGFSFVKAAREARQSEKALAALGHRAHKPPRRATPEEMAAARETVQRLSTPWDRLFGALEAAAIDDVALLGIEPDPKAGTVTITGDGKDYLAALSYVMNLSQADGLTQVRLARHEMRRTDPQRPVAFAVTARWAKP
jgi:hypothetical protein